MDKQENRFKDLYDLCEEVYYNNYSNDNILIRSSSTSSNTEEFTVIINNKEIPHDFVISKSLSKYGQVEYELEQENILPNNLFSAYDLIRIITKEYRLIKIQNLKNKWNYQNK